MTVSTQTVEPANIPVVDFNLLSSGTPQERNAALKQLDDAFQTFGFIYLSNHSIPQEMVAEAFAWVSLSSSFVSLPSLILPVQTLLRSPTSRQATDCPPRKCN